MCRMDDEVPSLVAADPAKISETASVETKPQDMSVIKVPVTIVTGNLR